MDEYQSIISIVSLTMGVSWASGINLYAALLMLGLGGATGNIDLPPGLETLADPLVIGAAGLMYMTEFFADKIPGVDSSWDAIHTFIRIPAGALLAMGAVGDVAPALTVAAAITGGGMSAASHATKAGTRLAVNMSPEPFSNWGLSIAEDIAVIAGLWAALTHPVLFLILLVLFLTLAIWLLPRIWRGIRFIFVKIGLWLGIKPQPGPIPGVNQSTGAVAMEISPPGMSADPLGELTRLKRLLDEGTISQQEFELLKAKMIS